MTLVTTFPDGRLPNGSAGNVARCPIDAFARIVALLAGYPGRGPGAHGESILGRPGQAYPFKPAAIARGRERAGADADLVTKGARLERAIVHALQVGGFAAKRVPLSGAAGGRYSGDIVLRLMGWDLCLEAKARADGSRELYSWLDQRDVLIVKADRQEALVVVRLSLAVEIAQAATVNTGKEQGRPIENTTISNDERAR